MVTSSVRSRVRSWSGQCREVIVSDSDFHIFLFGKSLILFLNRSTSMQVYKDKTIMFLKRRACIKILVRAEGSKECGTMCIPHRGTSYTYSSIYVSVAVKQG